MKRFFIIFLVLTCAYRLSAQDFLKQPFLDMTLNDITMAELFEDNIDWNFFKSKFGTPISETLKDYDGEYKDKNFVYSGIQFKFSDYLGPFEIEEVIIESSSYVFTYDGLQIKIGNQVSTLGTKFSEPYNARSDGRLIIFHEFADIRMRIHYNTSNVITKIELLHDLL